MKVLSSDLTPRTVLRKQAHIFLLQSDVTNFVDEVQTLTNKFKQECYVRFAYEISYPVNLNLCNETGSYEVCSLSGTLEKIQSNEENQPTEKVLLIVPDDIEPQFVNKLCQQLCLLQIPFEIQMKSYQKFVANSTQYLEELNNLQKLCEEYVSTDKEINSLVTELLNVAKNLESLMKQEKNVSFPVGVGDFPFDFDSTFGSQKHQSDFPVNASCVFLLTDANDDLRRLDEYDNLDKKNILFLLKKDANHLNIPLHLAMAAQNLDNRGFGNACLTFVDGVELTKDIIRSFCSYLKLNAWDATAFKKALEALKDSFLKLQEKFSKFSEDSSHHTESKQVLIENFHSEIKYLIDNEELLFNDILPKALLYDSQQLLEQFWRDFQKNYYEILDQIATSTHFGNENFLRQFHNGYMPEEVIYFLREKEFALNDTYNHMAEALRKCIQSFFARRISDLKKLLQADLLARIGNDPFNEKITFEQSKISFVNCFKEILTAEQLRMLIRSNSKMLFSNIQNADDIIPITGQFRRYVRWLLEIEINKKMTSAKARLLWEIFSNIKNSCSRISDAIHDQIESAKENFSFAMKESDTEGESLSTERNKFIKFWNEAQLATGKLQIQV